MSVNSSFGWSISSRIGYGGLFYSRLQWYYDGKVISALTPEIHTNVLVDLGAGTSQLGCKAINAGIQKVVVVENNPSMIKQLKKNRSQLAHPERMILIEENMYAEGLLNAIAKEHGPITAIHAKRCLYGSDENNTALLNAGYEILPAGGKMFIIHPEADFRKYVDNGVGGVALDHLAKRLFNDAFNPLVRALGNHQHRYYTTKELEALCRTACPHAQIEQQFSPRPAYNFLILSK